MRAAMYKVFLSSVVFFLLYATIYAQVGTWIELQGPNLVPSTNDIGIGYDDQGNRWVFAADSAGNGSVIRKKDSQGGARWEIIDYRMPDRMQVSENYPNIVCHLRYAFENRPDPGVFFSFNALDHEQVHWENRREGLDLVNASDIDIVQNSVDPNGENIRALVCRGGSALYEEDKIYKTTDSGISWHAQTQGIDQWHQFQDLDIFQEDPNYVVASGGVLKRQGQVA